MNENIHFFAEEIPFAVKQKKLLKQWVSESIRKEGFQPANINVIICSDNYLHRINVEYLAHDTFTDIITFDSSVENEISGDLFISIERVKENAKQFSKKTADELHRVIIHGLLHLCGYADKTDSEKEKMREKENIYLSRRPVKLRDS